MPGESYKAPEVTSEMRMKYNADAERRYRAMSEEQLQKEYNQLVRGNNPWQWFKERIGAFVNIVKIAVLSVFLGRRETARRIQSGNREAAFEQLKKEAQKEAKISTLEDKLEQLQKDREEKAKEAMDNPETEQQKKDEKSGQEVPEEILNPLDKEKEPPAIRKNINNISIFAEQLECITEKFRDGLRKHLEAQTGINAKFIQVENMTDKNNSYLRISFDSINFSNHAELAQGITITKNGNCLEQTEAAKTITKSVLYYTAEGYRESKNCTRVVGTVPSQAMCSDMVHAFINTALENKKKGDLNCIYEEFLFGHSVRFEKQSGSFRVFLDGNELSFPQGSFIKSLTDIIRESMLDKKNGDYTQQAGNVLSEQLHAIVKTEVEPVYFVKYSGKELEDYFNKLLDNITHDGGDSIREINFHGHNIKIHLDHQAIQSIGIDGEDVYRNLDGKQENEKIAEHIADGLGDKLAADEMYRYEESLEKLEDVIRFSNSDMQEREKVSDFEQSMEYDDHEDELE